MLRRCTTPSSCHRLPSAAPENPTTYWWVHVRYFRMLQSSIDMNFTGYDRWGRCSRVKQQLFQQQQEASRRRRPGPIPHGQSHACPGVGMREIIAGLVSLLSRNSRPLGPPIASNPATVRQADRRTSLLLSSLLGCMRLSTVWPDRANDVILNHVHQVRPAGRETS